MLTTEEILAKLIADLETALEQDRGSNPEFKTRVWRALQWARKAIEEPGLSGTHARFTDFEELIYAHQHLRGMFRHLLSLNRGAPEKILA